ncbi:holo-ACP synthase [Agrilactobacillus yilanensis]|uniref:Holo-[acyl-carrier-protein] synthase n=1 Tax=Agrilactobacillus yilanensis TaxID=2485997 RepID=A0ABW4J4R3_9LACO|nr:holo-ACP synthase [Agrilactobacillus yilanensis]
MIIGIGVDLTEIDRIKAALEKNQRFAEKVLTSEELAIFLEFPENSQRCYEFLAGRFSAKEAYAKALGTGIGKVGLHDIEILNDPTGRPIVTRQPFIGTALVSISHTASLVMTQVILQN